MPFSLANHVEARYVATILLALKNCDGRKGLCSSMSEVGFSLKQQRFTGNAGITMKRRYFYEKNGKVTAKLCCMCIR